MLQLWVQYYIIKICFLSYDEMQFGAIFWCFKSCFWAIVFLDVINLTISENRSKAG